MAKKRKSKMSTQELAQEANITSFHPRDMQSFYAWDGDVLVLNILGTPSAKKDVIGKPKGNQLKISVTAAPVGGRATDYMVKWLAKEFEVNKNDIEVVFGRMNVNKQLRIKNPKKLLKVIEKEEAKRQ
ncbi:COG1872 [hydrothermal vent metagenome]|uniref:COG1872 n=1 Tax=hydrothermal vent metagenome TaxID=652676 RepID=A0A1W1D526_9ZZZZ